MTFRGKIASLLSAAVLVLGFAVPALAQTDGQVQTAPIDVEIGEAQGGGTLTFSFIQNIPFPNVPFDNTAQEVNGGMTVSVQDTRGRSQGWQFSVSATTFTSPDSDDVIPVENFTLEPGSVTRVSGDPTLPVPAAPFVASTSSQVLLSTPQGTGNGRYSIPVTGTLVIPGGTDIGTYTSTLTGTLVTAP